ncbi:MAG: hypothetical protein ACI9LM_004150 [Alteromonadaceae bacterium]|jgi:hypothetical protein
MSTLKIFFCIISENGSDTISVHRDLNSIYTLWNNDKSIEKVGVMHIGFIRPNLPSSEEIRNFFGCILVSASVKWSLPVDYITSNKIAYSYNNLPFFQLKKGFGYNIEEYNELLACESSFEYVQDASDNSHTIVSAALEVLETVTKPMSKEEIFGHIIHKGLFHFGAKKPINVLNVELNRHCINTEYAHSYSNKVFGKTRNGLFYALSVSQDFIDWLEVLPKLYPELAKECVSLQVFDNVSYVDRRHEFKDELCRELDLIKFNKLKETIDINDPSMLLPILPFNILNASISQLGLTVRTSNVFSIQNIFCLKDAIGITFTEMMRWPNFGKKSAKDLCETLIDDVAKLVYQLPNSTKQQSYYAEGHLDESSVVNSEIKNTDITFEYMSKVPLKQHFDNSLLSLNDIARKILEYRTGYRVPVKTLEEVGSIIGVTRERIRQIQKKNIEKIITTEYWDDCIAIRIGELLIDRDQPLYLEMLEIEDQWFAGFMGNYQHLAAVIELFSESHIKLITVNGSVIISRISQDDWDHLLSDLRVSLKNKADELSWTRSDIELNLKSLLQTKGAQELLSILWNILDEYLQFSNDDLLIAYGKSRENAVYVVIQQAESPLHYSEVAIRASIIFGKPVEDRLAHNALPRVGAKLFGRGIYGLPKFNPLSNLICNQIRLVVTKLVYAGPLAKQWHVTEILNFLKSKFPSLPNTLDMYLLNIILEDSEQLTYLNKNVWARFDSDQMPTDRIDMADAFAKILDDAGKPMKGKEIKVKLQIVRGVHESLQIQPTDRMIQVGPDTWGLFERDIHITIDDITLYLDKLKQYLILQDKGIHVTEVPLFLNWAGLIENSVESYTLLSLAQRDERFYLGRSMFLGLSSWGEETRRLTNAEAVRKIIDEMEKPMSTIEINIMVSKLTGLDTDTSVTSILINEGAKFDTIERLWFKK